MSALPLNASAAGADLDWPFLVKAARKIYSSRKLGTAKNWYLLLSAALGHRRALREMLARPENRILREDLRAHPELLGFVEQPYIHATWPVMQRYEALSEHRRAVANEMKVLDVGHDGSKVVVDLSYLSPGVRLVLDRAPWMLREGSLVFNIFIGEERLMMMGFSFARLNGEWVAYVGSVQGSNSDSAVDIYRDVAKYFQSMRPRDLLIKSFQYLMFHLGVKHVLCIADAQRHHRHPYFTADKDAKFYLNYDDIWNEHSGEPRDDGFFRLAVPPVVRPLEEVVTKKRGLYRRRYAMMDEISADLGRFVRGEPPLVRAAAAAPADDTKE